MNILSTEDWKPIIVIYILHSNNVVLEFGIYDGWWLVVYAKKEFFISHFCTQLFAQFVWIMEEFCFYFFVFILFFYLSNFELTSKWATITHSKLEIYEKIAGIIIIKHYLLHHLQSTGLQSVHFHHDGGCNLKPFAKTITTVL